MSDHKIPWLNMPGFKGETWNPIVGCSKISEGCENCYAERMANRLSHISVGANAGWQYEEVITNGMWNGRTEPSFTSMQKPMSWKNPRIIFVCNMGDLFHETVKVWQRDVFETIEKCPQHIFILLTKRPQNAAMFFAQNPEFAYLPNVWLGVTAENQQRANERIPILLQIPAEVRFVSVEPMLGPVDLTSLDLPGYLSFLNPLHGSMFDTEIGGQKTNSKLDWVICGGESGPKARPMHPEWVRSLRDQCQAAQVPFFFKQWGEWISTGLNTFKAGDPAFRIVELNGSFEVMLKTKRKEAGHHLDGKEHFEFPKTAKP